MMVMALARETNGATDYDEAERDFREQLATASEMDVPGFRRLTVYSDPSERGYQTQTTVVFGKPVTVPAPFDFELDTSAFTD
jgi:hypothetical protein